MFYTGLVVICALLFIATIVAAIWFIAVTFCGASKDETQVAHILGSLICVFLLVWLLFSANHFTEDDNMLYKQGQIDAMNGIIRYELVTQPDSTRVWQWIETEDKD